MPHCFFACGVGALFGGELVALGGEEQMESGEALRIATDRALRLVFNDRPSLKTTLIYHRRLLPTSRIDVLYHTGGKDIHTHHGRVQNFFVYDFKHWGLLLSFLFNLGGDVVQQYRHAGNDADHHKNAKHTKPHIAEIGDKIHRLKNKIHYLNILS